MMSGDCGEIEDRSHGRSRLPGVTVESYNLDLRDGEGFLGDKASETAFRELLDIWRDRLADVGSKPFGRTPTDEIERDDLDEVLIDGQEDEDRKALRATMDVFCRDFADVLRRFLQTPGWEGVERIVCGGGFQTSRVGRAVVVRTEHLLGTQGLPVQLRSLNHDPDDGGLIGWSYAVSPELLRLGDAFLAVDIGGTNVRCGAVLTTADRPAAERVICQSKRSHADQVDDRDDLVDQIADMIGEGRRQAKAAGVRLSPFIGISCPGVILPDGTIDRGVQNLPGDWTAPGFRLPDELRARLDDPDGRPAEIRMHNDAVIQGLSEWPWMRDVDRWAAVTIGTGLGNCSFSNRNLERGIAGAADGTALPDRRFL